MRENFIFQDHPASYSKYKAGEHFTFTFRNDFLKSEEDKDDLNMHDKSITEFRRIGERFGTISFITNLHE